MCFAFVAINMALSEPLCLLLAAYSDEMTAHQVIQLFLYRQLVIYRYYLVVSARSY